MEFDDTIYVEAGDECTNLTFTDEKQQARFELAVSMMVYKWDDLETAVDNGWGGPDSAAKRDWITAIIIDLFKTQKVVDAALIEETMLYAMMDEFDTNVEDESALPIAVGIINLYKECAAHNYNTLEGLYLKWEEKQRNKPHHVKHIHVEEDPMNPDSCIEEEDEEIELVEDDAETRENQSKTELIVDDDGFELVQKKGKH